MPDEKTRLLARKAKIEAQLAALAKIEAKKHGRNEERRAMLAGRIVLARATMDEAFGMALMKMLNQALTSPRDRALFALEQGGAGQPPDQTDTVEKGRNPEAESSTAD